MNSPGNIFMKRSHLIFQSFVACDEWTTPVIKNLSFTGENERSLRSLN
jgi:hypothetical protein